MAGDYCNTVQSLQITPGGYQVAKDADGRIVSLPKGSAFAATRVSEKLGRELSRVTRMTRGEFL